MRGKVSRKKFPIYLDAAAVTVLVRGDAADKTCGFKSSCCHCCECAVSVGDVCNGQCRGTGAALLAGGGAVKKGRLRLQLQALTCF